MTDHNSRPPDQPDEKMDQIISELKQFLSGIKSENPQSINDSSSTLDSPDVDPFLSENSLETVESIDNHKTPIGDPDFGRNGYTLPSSESNGVNHVEEKTPVVGSKLPSDVDFWNGNVLGWTVPPEGESNQPSAGAHPFFKDEIKMGASIPEEESSMPPMNIPERESEPLTDASSSFDTPVPSFFGHPQPSPFSVPESEPQEPPRESQNIKQEEKEAAFSAFVNVPEASSPDPGFNFPSKVIFNESAPSMAPSSPVVPERPSVNEVHLDLHSPLPQDISSNEVKKNEGQERSVEDAHDMKPENLRNVACIIPFDKKMDGQMFFNKLRDAAAKAKNKIDVEAVFIHDWSPESIDLEAWEKSAILSGADAMFIVVNKKDQTQFQALLNNSKHTPFKKHLILVEQIKLQNLYAELVYRLNRKG